jgi:hypothetical protein
MTGHDRSPDKVMPEAPPNGTRAVWYIQNGRIGVFGHWQDGELVEDRRMTWIQTQGGGSTAAGLLRVFFRWSLNVGILLALLYALVWFVQRAWTADVPGQHSLNRIETLGCAGRDDRHTGHDSAMASAPSGASQRSLPTA